jgi:hypothetical protein
MIASTTSKALTPYNSPQRQNQQPASPSYIFMYTRDEMAPWVIESTHMNLFMNAKLHHHEVKKMAVLIYKSKGISDPFSAKIGIFLERLVTQCL